MKLKNSLIVVEDLERSKKFYRDLFGLEVILDRDGNVMLTEGLVLQEKAVWGEHIAKPVILPNHASELYFEEKQLDAFVQKLEQYDLPVTYVTPLTELPWGQKIVRLYDPDGNLLEVRTPN